MTLNPEGLGLLFFWVRLNPEGLALLFFWVRLNPEVPALLFEKEDQPFASRSVPTF